MITALVLFAFFQIHCAAGNIHFAPNNRFEQFVFRLHYLCFTSCNLRLFIFTLYGAGFNSHQPFFQVLDFTFRTTILLIDVVRKFLNTEHISMIGHGNTLHSILHCFIDQTSDASLTVQKGILRMDV